MRTGVRSALPILLVVSVPLIAQGPPDELTQWIEAHAQAVKAYGRGEREAAIRAIAERPLPDQRRIVSQVLKILAAKATGEEVKTLWTLDDAAIAGALHMDAALAAYRRADVASLADLAEHIKLGEAWFDFRRSGDEAAQRAPRWELAIGLTALADGRFGVAETMLDGACAKYPQFAPLQLACGSVHESLAALPVDQLVRSSEASRNAGPRVNSRYAPTDPVFAVDRSSAALARAKALRTTQVSKARRAFDRAVRLDPGDAEAHIRLAHIDVLEGKDEAAATRLEPILERKDLDLRLSFLARLFLGDVRARLGRVDEARALLEAAIASVPSGQSAHMALARAVRTSGDHDQSSALLHRMMNAPIKPDDPMIGYRFGQYWVPDPLIDTLRSEALRR